MTFAGEINLLKYLRLSLFRWLALASSTAAFACGPGLTEQVRLVRIQDRAVLDCTTGKKQAMCETGVGPKCKAALARCQVALACVEPVTEAVKAIQTVQETRAKGQIDIGQEAAAKGAYSSALAACKVGGWQ